MIVFSDFDNTLYTHDDADFERNLKSIKDFRKRGNKFCVATGRNWASLERVWPGYTEYLDYVVLDNGAVCYDGQGNEIFREIMPRETVKKITAWAQEKFRGGIQFVFYYNSGEWEELGDEMTKIRCWTKDKTIAQEICNEVNTTYGKVLQGYVARTAMMTTLSWIKNPEQYHSFVDIMTEDAGKEVAIRRIHELWPNEQVITIGDDTNDVTMLREFNGYAMCDAMPEALDAVVDDHVVGSVAELLDSLLKLQKEV